MDRPIVEVKVHQFVMDYGAEQLITWLAHFDTVITSREYPLYRNLERTACSACEVTLADMRKFTNAPCTNAKRIIAFLAFHKIKLKVPSIANLLNTSERTINYYMKDVEEWISSPKANKPFFDAYNTVIENFKIE